MSEQITDKLNAKMQIAKNIAAFTGCPKLKIELLALLSRLIPTNSLADTLSKHRQELAKELREHVFKLHNHDSSDWQYSLRHASECYSAYRKSQPNQVEETCLDAVREEVIKILTHRLTKTFEDSRWRNPGEIYRLDNALANFELKRENISANGVLPYIKKMWDKFELGGRLPTET